MAGVKGRSGRQKAPFQMQRQRVIDKAWEVMEQALNDSSLTLTQRAELAKGIVVKNIPQELEGSGTKQPKIIVQIIDLQERASQLISQRSIN